MHDAEALIARMDPQLGEEEFAFCTAPAPVECDAVCTFKEQEGITLIVKKADAERLGLPFTFPCRRITLLVHSSLEAVGFFARIAARLAEHGIATNCVSAYHHDHLFVPLEDADRALLVLQELQRSALL